jgi:cold shock CspA family protein
MGDAVTTKANRGYLVKRDTRTAGTVRWYKEVEGYGEITAEDEDRLWFHLSSLQIPDYRVVEAGQAVSFVWKGAVHDGLPIAEDILVGGDS